MIMDKNEEEIIKANAIEEFKKQSTYQVIEFAKQLQSLQQTSLEEINKYNKKNFYKKYTPDQVDRYLSDPIKYEQQLIDISRYLSVASPQYLSLMNYFPMIAILKPIVIPFNTYKMQKDLLSGGKKAEKIEKLYYECIKLLDNMNIGHEYLKILQTICREDVFYGYEVESENSYYIRKFNPKYCRISGMYDGCLKFEFDFSYFDNEHVDITDYYKNIDREFLKKYNKYKKSSAYRWQELNLEKEVCVKFNESLGFCCPPYISVFNDLYDIQDYKDLNKARVEIDNTRFIGFEMETRDGKNGTNGKLDDFKLDVNTMQTYFSFIQTCLNGKIGTFMSPMPFKEIEFSKSSSDIDNVAKSINNYWSSVGVAPVLFGENKNAGTLKYSIMTDEALLFSIYKQIKRILSRKMKIKSNGMFVVDLPELTIFNAKDEFDKYLKASQYGFQGAITYAESALGMSQQVSLGLGLIEQKILNKKENMIPVSSSYTENGKTEDNNGGREKETDDTKVSDSSQQTRDNNSNENR